MTTAQSLITIGIIALGTVFTRFLPFWLFPKGKPAPRIVAYLGKVLPCAVMGLLVVYCLKDVQPAAAPYGLPELIAVAATAGLHVWKKNTLLSVGVGTVLYMLLVQLVLLVFARRKRPRRILVFAGTLAVVLGLCVWACFPAWTAGA